MMVGRNREDFQEAVTFELSSENFRMKKFRHDGVRRVQAEKIRQAKA